ncbi:RNA polymerase subunit sigma-24, partial [Streptomyces varsoviensis]
MESARIIAGVARIVRDVGIAEELAQDALVAALEQWPESGVPEKPGAWLMATAKHRAIDLVRRKETYARKLAEVGRAALTDVPPPGPGAPEGAVDPTGSADAMDADGMNDMDGMDGMDGIEDDLLRLIFTACHPVLSAEARIALTLRLLGGLTTQEIARAFLVPEPTVAQRVVRAKRTLAKAGVPFEVPGAAERAARLSSVLEVIYLIFNEGYSATAGDDLVRPALCEDALRLARVLAGLMPGEAEVHGLAALLEFQASRITTRTDPEGAPVLLADQDRSRWNRMLIRRGIEALHRAGN